MGYASAPEGQFDTAQDLINYRYNGNFDLFDGGTPPTPIPGTHGSGVSGKANARGTEQAKYQEYVDELALKVLQMRKTL